MHGVFAYAVKRGYLATNPAVGTAPKQARVRQSRPELRFLTERELETAVQLAGAHGDLLTVTVAEAPARRIEGKPSDDFVFAARSGLPLHNGDFYTHVWRKLKKARWWSRGSRPFGSMT